MSTKPPPAPPSATPAVPTPPPPVLALVNHSARVTDAELAAIAAALTLQIARDFAPAWGLAPTRVVATTPTKLVPGAQHLAVVDAPDDPNALGYHVDEGGVYDGFVFVNPVLDNGGTVLGNPADPAAPSVASVASHEALELLGDPTTGRWADCGGGRDAVDGSGTFAEVAWEACDPCEGDGYALSADGGRTHVVVSNFVLTAWFDPVAPATARFDFLRRLRAAFTMDAGGYMIVRTAPGDERQVFGARVPAWRRELKARMPLRGARRLPRAARRTPTMPPPGANGAGVGP